MSRGGFLVLLVFIGAAAAGRGGGRGGGGHSHSHGHGSHSYPSSTGLSGSQSYGHNTHASAGQAATYPHSTGLSGHGSAPSQGNHHTYQKTEVHHHYYSPPQHISYGSGYHPVYRERPPVYVYEYRNSGSRFDTLLTGLALYNLGRMSAHHDHHYYDTNREYHATPGEMCKLQINKNTGEYEETRIDCKLMSSFIWDAEMKHQQEQNRVQTSNTVTVTKVENTVENGTVVSTTTQNTTVTDALKVKGPSLQVTPGMQCYMIRISRDYSSLKKEVDCGLLQAYAVNSFRNDSCRNVPALVLIVLSLLTFPLL